MKTNTMKEVLFIGGPYHGRRQKFPGKLSPSLTVTERPPPSWSTVISPTALTLIEHVYSLGRVTSYYDSPYVYLYRGKLNDSPISAAECLGQVADASVNADRAVAQILAKISRRYLGLADDLVGEWVNSRERYDMYHEEMKKLP